MPALAIVEDDVDQLIDQILGFFPMGKGMFQCRNFAVFRSTVVHALFTLCLSPPRNDRSLSMPSRIASRSIPE